MGDPRASSVLLLVALFCSGRLHAQQGETFAYTGTDALRNAANVHFLHYGGLANNFILDEQTVVLPYLPSLVYEAGYLVLPGNQMANLCLSAMPEVFFYPWFMARVTGILDATFLNEAQTHEERGVGFRFGVGYSALGSTFNFTESSPVLRAGLLISNIRVTYTYSWGRQTVIDQQVAIAIKFDW